MQIFRNIYIMSIITKINIVILTFISSILLNRYLGPTLKGQYSYIINYVNIISLILTFNITKALPYYKKKLGEEIEKQFINFIYLQTIVYFCITLAINYFNSNKTLMTIMAISIISQLYQQVSFIAIIKDLNKKNLLNMIDMLVYTIFLFSIFFIDIGNKFDLAIYTYTFRIILGTILYVGRYNIVPNSSGIDFQKFKEVLIFSFFPTISALLITFNYKVDIVILKFFTDFTQIGLYSLGVTLASMLWIIPDAFKDVLFNKTARSDSIKDIVFSIKFNIHISLIVIIGFMFFGKHFIKIMYGEDFIGASSVVIMLFVGNIPMIFFKMINTLYIAKGKQKMALFILILSVSINIISNIVLIPIYGIKGAAISSVLSYSLCGIVFLYTFIKSYKINLKYIILYDNEEIKRVKYLFRRVRRKC